MKIWSAPAVALLAIMLGCAQPAADVAEGSMRPQPSYVAMRCIDDSRSLPDNWRFEPAHPAELGLPRAGFLETSDGGDDSIFVELRVCTPTNEFAENQNPCRKVARLTEMTGAARPVGRHSIHAGPEFVVFGEGQEFVAECTEDLEQRLRCRLWRASDSGTFGVLARTTDVSENELASASAVLEPFLSTSAARCVANTAE